MVSVSVLQKSARTGPNRTAAALTRPRAAAARTAMCKVLSRMVSLILCVSMSMIGITSWMRGTCDCEMRNVAFKKCYKWLELT